MAVDEDIVVYDQITGKAFRHDGFSLVVKDDFVLAALFASITKDIAFDSAGNLMQCSDFFTDTIVRYDGFSAVVTDSIAAPAGAVSGISWGFGDLVSSDQITNLVYFHDGFSTTITASWATGFTQTRYGIHYQELDPAILSFVYVNFDDLLGGTRKFNLVGTNFGTVGNITWNSDMQGVSWDGTNLIVVFDFLSLGSPFMFYRRYVGFTTTINLQHNQATIAEPFGGKQFVEKIGGAGTRRQRQVKSLIRSRRRRSC